MTVEDKTVAQKDPFSFIDPWGVRRLYINGIEIMPRNKPGIGPQAYALLTILTLNSIFGHPIYINRYSEEFNAAWRKLTGQEAPSAAALKAQISYLRRALEDAGVTISRVECNRNRKREKINRQTSYKLISYKAQ